jgi:signal transduction histidine kinase
VTVNDQSLIEPRADRTQVKIACTVGVLWLAGGICCHLYGDPPLHELPSFIIIVDSTHLVSDLVVVTLLFALASIYRYGALLVLAAGYMFSAQMSITHALTFPGAFAPTGLLDASLSTTAWLAIFWRAGFPPAIIIYATRRSNKSFRFARSSTGVVVSIAGASIMALGLSMIAIFGARWLPPLVDGPRAWHLPYAVPVVAVTMAFSVIAIAMLLRGQHSRLDGWLLISLGPWMVYLLLIISTPGRYTLAWYFAQAAGVLSYVIMLLGLITESSRTYARLALSDAAWERERDARLMSMDAVAAAIAHEVGQPLAAIATNAGAGLHWLDRAPPDLEMATQSLQSNMEQAQRASDLIGSVRAVLTKRSGERSKFGLNELMRDTATLLTRELTAANISLEFVLDEALPPIVADRLQMQQVLINLLTNAIQSLTETRGRPRRIVIRSAPIEGREVRLDVTDNGIGISAEKMEHIFDAFFTTKTTGTGIGLSLCRTIVEMHGGHLWASQGEERGVTFHLQLQSEPFA